MSNVQRPVKQDAQGGRVKNNICRRSEKQQCVGVFDFGHRTLDFGLLKFLADLFRTKCANAIEPETEDHAIFLSHADVEGIVLRRDGAAVPAITQRHSRTHQRAIAAPLPGLKIEKERRPAEETALAITGKD